MALRTYVKLLVNSAWCWGSWALIRNLVPLPSGGSIPNYVGVLYSIWECVFFAALLVFIEKFLLQLIGECTRKSGCFCQNLLTLFPV